MSPEHTSERSSAGSNNEITITIVGDEYNINEAGEGAITNAVRTNLDKALRDKGLAINLGDNLVINFVDESGNKIGTLTNATRIRVQALCDDSDLLLGLLLKSAWKEKDESIEENRVELPIIPVHLTQQEPQNELDSSFTAGSTDASIPKSEAAPNAAAIQVDRIKLDSAKLSEQGREPEKIVTPQMEEALLHLLEDRRDREQREKDQHPALRGEESPKKNGAFRTLLKRALPWIQYDEPLVSKRTPLRSHWGTALFDVQEQVIKKAGEDSNDARLSKIISIVGLKNKDSRVRADVGDFLMQIVDEPATKASRLYSSRVSVKDIRLAKLWLREHMGMTPLEEEIGGGTNSITLDRVLGRLDSSVPAIRAMAIRQLSLVADGEMRMCTSGRDFDEERAMQLVASFQKASQLQEFSRLNKGDVQEFADKRQQIHRTVARRTGTLRGEGGEYGAVNVDPGAERRRGKLGKG